MSGLKSRNVTGGQVNNRNPLPWAATQSPYPKDVDGHIVGSRSEHIRHLMRVIDDAQHMKAIGKAHCLYCAKIQALQQELEELTG